MKKFLSKKPVMIAFIIAAVAFLAIYIGMMVRPIAYGFNYTYKDKEDGITTTFKFNVKNNKTMTVTEIKESENGRYESVIDYWVYVDGNKVKMIGSKDDMTKKEYEKIADELYELSKKDDKESKAEYKLAMVGAMELDLFKYEEGKIDYRNNQQIAFAVAHGVVTVALIAFAALSVVLVIKKKA